MQTLLYCAIAVSSHSLFCRRLRTTILFTVVWICLISRRSKLNTGNCFLIFIVVSWTWETRGWYRVSSKNYTSTLGITLSRQRPFSLLFTTHYLLSATGKHFFNISLWFRFTRKSWRNVSSILYAFFKLQQIQYILYNYFRNVVHL